MTADINGAARIRLLIACTAAYCVANATWWVQPILIAQLVATRGYSASGAGLVVTAEMVVMAFTAFALAKALKSTRFLWVGALGTATAVVGSFLTFKASSFQELIAVRVVVGFGEGAALMVSNTAVAYFADPDRTFGKIGTANVMFGALAVLFLPLVHGTGPTPSTFIALTVALCALTPAVMLMPADLRLLTGAESESAVPANVSLHVPLLCASIFIIGMISGVMWTYYALIGTHAGLDEAAVDGAIAVAILTAILGAALAALLGKSIGRLIPISIGLVAMTSSILALGFGPNALTFRIATGVNIASVYFMLPFLFASGSAQSASGRGAASVASTFVLTGALSPYVGGLLADSVGAAAMGVAAVPGAIIAWLMFAHVDRRTRTRSRFNYKTN